MLAEIANDPAEDTFTRVLAKSVLAKEEFVLQLWMARTECIPLVYELLLAMGKRLFSTHPSPYQQNWHLSG